MTEYISKSERKRRFRHEELAAEELTKLSAKQLALLPADQEVKDVIVSCRKLKGGALNRQIKHLAKVMRGGDVDALFTFLEDRKGSSLKTDRLLREAERLRDTIINEAVEDQHDCLRNGMLWGEDWPSNEIEVLAKRLSWVNANDIRRATYLYVRTKKHTHYKELYKIIRAALEREELTKKRAA